MLSQLLNLGSSVLVLIATTSPIPRIISESCVLELLSGQAAAHMGENEPLFHKMHLLPSETKEVM